MCVLSIDHSISPTHYLSYTHTHTQTYIYIYIIYLNVFINKGCLISVRGYIYIYIYIYRLVVNEIFSDQSRLELK